MPPERHPPPVHMKLSWTMFLYQLWAYSTSRAWAAYEATKV
jgi:hypothetical protein